jgi:catechol 2,3-dioxygenase-like lactoylglutathione lyase family enzyme
MGASAETSKAAATPSFLSAAPTFLVNDVGSTAEWYEKHLGFLVSPFPKNKPYVYASLQRDGVEIMLLRTEGYQKPEISRPGGAWDAYIRIRGVGQFYESVRHDVPIHLELVKQSYGNWEFEVRDPNGYILAFGELIDGE